MAKLKIKKYVNNNEKMPKAYGKTYGRIEHVDTLDTIDLAKHIQRHGSIFTRDVIVGVLEKFSMCIEELLQDGYKVKLNGLGMFKLMAESIGEENTEDFTIAKDIKQLNVRFLPERSDWSEWASKVQKENALGGTGIEFTDYYVTYEAVQGSTAKKKVYHFLDGSTVAGGGDDDGGDDGEEDRP
jgi:predicted histone-like DNA-binding protein